MRVGRCSKHRKMREFKDGDRVRIVCTGGFSGSDGSCRSTIGAEGSVLHLSPLGSCQIYKDGLEQIWGGLILVHHLPCGHHHYFSPRALEIITQQ